MMKPGAFYANWLSMAKLEIVEAYERASNEKFPPELNELADLATDTAVSRTPEWRKEHGDWVLYFGEMRFGDK